MKELTEAIQSVVDRMVLSIHTCLPGRIEKYDYKTQKAEVKPLVKQDYNDDIPKSWPVIVNVPVIFPRSANFILHFPLLKDDYVLILFSEKALEKWLSMGSETESGDIRRFDITDAIAVPGLFPFSVNSLADNNSDVVMQYKSTGMRIKDNGDIEIGKQSFLKLVTENFKNMFNSHVHVFTDIIYPVGTPSPAVTGVPANITGVGIVDPGINPMVVPALPVAIGNNELTSKTRAE